MSMISESEGSMMPNNGVHSPSFDDATNSGGNDGGNSPLKKGPWTSAEDAILIEYVTKHGEGNWNAVQKHSGLARCGKSCRLRWANHLRPDLKKGAFTPEEERRIIELHAKMGNKWARMAAELPGRTDNEIKNYWNTRIKRRQRAGLPIYPDDIRYQASNDNQQSDDTNTFLPGDMHRPNFMPVDNLEFPFVEFKTLDPKKRPLYSPPLFNNPGIPLFTQGVHSSSYDNKSLISTLHYPSKRLRGPEFFHPSFNNNVSICGPFLNQYQSDVSSKSFDFSAYDENAIISSTKRLFIGHGSHADLNGKTLASEPPLEMKLELPSLQTHNWGTTPSSPLPFFESVDTLIQSPPIESAANISPDNSGLLDAVLCEAETLKKSRNSDIHQTPRDLKPTVEMMDNPTHVIPRDTEWEPYEEQLSSLGHSSPSVFSESTPISGNSFDEPHSAETLPVNDEARYSGPMHYDCKAETSNQMMFSRPDFLLASNCFVPMRHPSDDHYLLKDAIGTLLGDDLSSRDCKKTDTGADSSAQGHGHDSCAWNKTPMV